MKNVLLFTVTVGLFLNVGTLCAQRNVRAWYAKGQVWVIWETNRNPSKTDNLGVFYELDTVTARIYASQLPITSPSDDKLVGRLFNAEWSGAELKRVGGTFFTIPGPNGSPYTLKANEGVFAYTSRKTEQLYFAVLEDAASYSASQMSTTAAVPTQVRNDDPPTCQEQFTQNVDGFPKIVYAMWIDGDNDYNAGRVDYHVMGNKHKRGTPHLFAVIEPKGGIQGQTNIPVVHLLHGGQGSLDYWLPTVKTTMDVIPRREIVVSHDDHLCRRAANQVLTDEGQWWFGYARSYDPFKPIPIDVINQPPYDPPADTVFDYDIQRLNWIYDWVNHNFPVDTLRINLEGHSVGSAGAMAWGKREARRFASITSLNSGFDGPSPNIPSVTLFGSSAHNLPTNCRALDGHVVHMSEIWDFHSHTSANEADLPLTRAMCGKNDVNPTMMWDSIVVANFRIAERSSDGQQMWWDERPHGVDEWNGFFAHGSTANNQMERDNISYLRKYRRYCSYPALYNFSAYQSSPDPGNGSYGTTKTNPSGHSGDDSGTWGGYCDWNPDLITDKPNRWSCDIYLIDSSKYTPDNCPQESISCDVAIRRAQHFSAEIGASYVISISNPRSALILRSDTVRFKAPSDLVVKNMSILRYPNATRIDVSRIDLSSAVEEDQRTFVQYSHDNNARMLTFNKTYRHVSVYSISGSLVVDGFNTDHLSTSALQPGVYLLALRSTLDTRCSTFIIGY